MLKEWVGFLIFILKFVVKIFTSFFIAFILIVQSHLFSNEGCEAVVTVACTILVYCLLFRIKDIKNFDFKRLHKIGPFSWFREVLSANSRMKEGINNVLLLENKLNEKKLLNVKELDSVIHFVKSEYGFDEEKISKYLLRMLTNTINNASNQGVISEYLERNIKQVCCYRHFTRDNAPELFVKLSKNRLLRDILNGKLPEIEINNNLPFIFLKGEKIVWNEKNVRFLIVKDKVSYRGGSAGYSIRIAKGVYLRQNSYKGKPVHSNVLEYEDTGIIIITNMHIYFGGEFSKFRIKYNKILSYEPYKNGIIVQKDAASARPMFFEVSDPVFVYNLIVNLVQHGEY